MSKTRCFRNVLVLFWITVTFAWALEIHKVFFKKKNPGGRGLKAFLHSVAVVQIFFFGRNNPAVYKADCLETLSLVFFFSLHFCALSLAQAGRLAVSLSLSLSKAGNTFQAIWAWLLRPLSQNISLNLVDRSHWEKLDRLVLS